jgi:hypothetical protein
MSILNIQGTYYLHMIQARQAESLLRSVDSNKQYLYFFQGMLNLVILSTTVSISSYCLSLVEEETVKWKCVQQFPVTSCGPYYGHSTGKNILF